MSADTHPVVTNTTVTECPLWARWYSVCDRCHRQVFWNVDGWQHVTEMVGA